MLEGERNASGFHPVSRDQQPVSLRHGTIARRFEAQLRYNITGEIRRINTGI